MKGFIVSSRISIQTSPVCFAMKKCPSATSIYLSVSTNETGINPKYLVPCDKLHLSLKYNWSVASCLNNLF